MTAVRVRIHSELSNPRLTTSATWPKPACASCSDALGLRARLRRRNAAGPRPLLEGARGGRASPKSQELIAPAAGAYFGEVVRAHHARRALVRPRRRLPRRTGSSSSAFFLYFNPIGVAMEVVAGEDADGWGAHFQVLDDARQAVQRFARKHGRAVDSRRTTTPSVCGSRCCSRSPTCCWRSSSAAARPAPFRARRVPRGRRARARPGRAQLVGGFPAS